MAEPSDTAKALTFEQLVEFRAKTEALSQFLSKQLKAHLETLRLLLAPRRLLGKYVGVKEEVVGADKAFAQLQELYRGCLLYTSPSPRDGLLYRMPSSA